MYVNDVTAKVSFPYFLTSLMLIILSKYYTETKTNYVCFICFYVLHI